MAIQAAVLILLLGFHYRHVLTRLEYIWRNNGDWSHGFIIPLFSLYYLYSQRHRMPVNLADHSISSRLAGLGLLALAFCTYAGSTFYQIEYPKQVALVISIMGVVLVVCGWPMARWSWFAVAFLVFALPLPERIYVQMTMPLRFIAAQVSAGALSVLIPDMLAEAQGAVVDYAFKGRAGTLDIEQACSGIRLMMTMMALGVAMAFINERPMWQRLVMILSVVPIAVFCNVIRVTTTGVFYVLGYEDLARGSWHMLLGLGMLFVAFALYGGISYILSHLVVEGEADELPAREMVTGGVVE